MVDTELILTNLLSQSPAQIDGMIEKLFAEHDVNEATVALCRTVRNLCAQSVADPDNYKLQQAFRHWSQATIHALKQRRARTFDNITTVSDVAFLKTMNISIG